MAVKPYRAPRLNTLVKQVDVMYPGRSKETDGWIGDDKHQARQSDHNPLPSGLVLAQDITDDPAHGLNIAELGQKLLDTHDPSINYVIYHDQILVPAQRSWIPKFGWFWQRYGGIYHEHLHISVNESHSNNTAPWAIGGSMFDEKTVKTWILYFVGRDANENDLEFAKPFIEANDPVGYSDKGIIHHPDFVPAYQLKDRVKELEAQAGGEYEQYVPPTTYVLKKKG